MKKTATAILAISTLLLATTPLFAAESQTLTGDFIWERSDDSISGDLKAVFEPTGDAAWNVSFHFTFDEKKHVYSGTATGSLTEGELKGRVMSDGETPQPFEFEGSFNEGAFEGVHKGFRQGEPTPTGTLRLSR
ncbi:MAG: hypothetical protein AAGN66_25505 [Acidobacteriota bacterium]